MRYKKKMEHKLKEARNEIEDLTAEFQREREQMLETIRGQARFLSRGRHCLSLSLSLSLSLVCIFSGVSLNNKCVVLFASSR